MTQVEQNIVNAFRGKSVLFLENDLTLDNGVDEFWRVLTDNGIECKLFNTLFERDIEDIKEAIIQADVIVFMTQWVSDYAKVLHSFISNLPDKKDVVEVYLSEPTWYYKPDVIHDVYLYSCMVNWGVANKRTENFYKLSETAYWDYKNEFDK